MQTKRLDYHEAMSLTQYWVRRKERAELQRRGTSAHRAKQALDAIELAVHEAEFGNEADKRFVVPEWVAAPNMTAT